MAIGKNCYCKGVCSWKYFLKILFTLAKIDSFGLEPFFFLTVKNLQVDTINGFPAEDELLRGLLKYNDDNDDDEESVDVTIIVDGNLNVTSLNAKTVNEIDFDKFLNDVSFLFFKNYFLPSFFKRKYGKRLLKTTTTTGYGKVKTQSTLKPWSKKKKKSEKFFF